MKDPYTGNLIKECEAPPMYTEYQYNRMAEKFFKEEERAEIYLSYLQDCQRELTLLRDLVKEHGL